MIYSFLFGLLILLVTTLVGSTLISRLPKMNFFLTLSALNLLGMALLVWAASLTEILGESFLVPCGFILGLCSIIVFLKGFNRRKEIFHSKFLQNKNTSDIIKLTSSLLLGYFVTILHNPSFFTSKMSFRVGPDLAGWTIGTKYFSENTSRKKLIEAVNQQLGIDQVDLAFRSPFLYPDTYISRISSFSDQVAAEFLVGAGRTGLPKFLAVFCEILPNQLNNIMVGGLVWTVIVTSLLVFGILEGQNLSIKLIFGVAFISIFNINTISVLMEGGYGQFLSTPFLVAALFFQQSRHLKVFAFPMILIFSLFSLNAYQDGFIAYMVITTLYLAIKFISKEIILSKVFDGGKKLTKPLLLFLIINLHQIYPQFKMIVERFNSNGVIGGWDQGKIAMPVNLLGVFNWLPYNQANHSWGFGFLVVVIMISALLLFLLYIGVRDSKLHLVLALFLGFLLLNFLVYRDGLETNNFQIWKFMGYATPLIWLIILTENYSEYQLKIQRFIKKATCAVLVIAVVTTSTWTVDWLKFRTFTFETKKTFKSSVVDKYDIAVIGYSSVNVVSLILQGDLRFFGTSRAFGLPTIRSFPERDLAYLMEVGQCDEYSCLSAFVNQRDLESPEAFEVIYKDDDIVVFRGIKD